MPGSARKSVPQNRISVAQPQPRLYDLSGKLATALIGMLGTLICTGVISMITIYARVTTLTDTVQAMQQQVQRSIDHTVDRDEYLRRDTQVQSALDRTATKDELRVLQHQLDEQTETLKVIEGAVSSRLGRREFSLPSQ